MIGMKWHTFLGYLAKRNKAVAKMKAKGWLQKNRQKGMRGRM